MQMTARARHWGPIRSEGRHTASGRHTGPSSDLQERTGAGDAPEDEGARRWQASSAGSAAGCSSEGAGRRAGSVGGESAACRALATDVLRGRGMYASRTRCTSLGARPG